MNTFNRLRAYNPYSNLLYNRSLIGAPYVSPYLRNSRELTNKALTSVYKAPNVDMDLLSAGAR